MSRNAGDKDQVQEAEKREQQTRDQELLDIQAILQTEGGRRFVWRLLGLCGLFRTSFTGNSTTFFNEGRRDIGLQLLADMTEADPEAYSKMSIESKKREVSNA